MCPNVLNLVHVWILGVRFVRRSRLVVGLLVAQNLVRINAKLLLTDASGAAERRLDRSGL